MKINNFLRNIRYTLLQVSILGVVFVVEFALVVEVVFIVEVVFVVEVILIFQVVLGIMGHHQKDGW